MAFARLPEFTPPITPTPNPPESDPWLDYMPKNCWKLVTHYLGEKNPRLTDYAALTALSYSLVYAIFDEDEALADLFFYLSRMMLEKEQIELTITQLNLLSRESTRIVRAKEEKIRENTPWYKNPWQLLKLVTLIPSAVVAPFGVPHSRKEDEIKDEGRWLISLSLERFCALTPDGANTIMQNCGNRGPQFELPACDNWTAEDIHQCKQICDAICKFLKEAVEENNEALTFYLIAGGLALVAPFFWICNYRTPFKRCIDTNENDQQKKPLKSLLSEETKVESKRSECKEVAISITPPYEGLEDRMISLTGKSRDEIEKTSTADVLTILKNKLTQLKKQDSEQKNTATFSFQRQDEMFSKLFNPVKIVDNKPEKNDAQNNNDDVTTAQYARSNNLDL